MRSLADIDLGLEARVFDLLPGAVCVVRLRDARILRANGAFTRMLGHPPDGLGGRRLPLAGPEDASSFEGLLETILARVQAGETELSLPLEARDGTRREVRCCCAVGDDPVHGPVWVATCEHLPVAPRAEPAGDALLASVFESLPVGVFVVDADGRINRANRAAREIWGGARLVGMSQYGEYLAWWAETGEPLHADEWAVVRALREGEPTFGDLLRIRRFDGRDGTILNSALPLRDAGGAIVGALVVNEDVSAVAGAVETLRTRVREREDILRMVSHDLRSPLSALKLSVGLLQRAARDDTQRAPAEAMDRLVGRMLRLVEDLLDATRLEGGALRIEPAEVDVVELVAEALACLPEDRQARVRCRCPEVPVPVHADPQRVLQVLANLLDNAFKHGGEGGVTLSVEAVDGVATVRVKDTGDGLAAAELDRVFERFWQAPGASGKAGAGLGLYISRGIVEAHGGRLWATSAPGEGAEFAFTLPTRPGAAPLPVSPPAS